MADCPRRANARVVVTDQSGAHFPVLSGATVWLGRKWRAPYQRRQRT